MCHPPPTMYKRPSPFKHGCSAATPLSDYNLNVLMTALEPFKRVSKKSTYIPATGHMYPIQREWFLRRSELTTEKREEFFQQYQRDGDTTKYLTAIHMLPLREPDIKIPDAAVRKEVPIFWGYAKLILEIEGDHVKVHVDGKLGDIHANYFQKGKKPPLRPYAEALMSYGKTADQVNSVIDGYVWWKKNKQLMQDQFDTLFPPEKKKGTVVKKKEFKPVVKRTV